MKTYRNFEKKQAVIIYDGVCVLCSRFVRFIIKHDERDLFRFGALQSDNVQSFLKHKILVERNINTIVLIKDKHVYTQSDAVLEIAKELGGVFQLLYAFFIVPKFIRDAVYRLIAKKRYSIFGKTNKCTVPSNELANKFLT